MSELFCLLIKLVYMFIYILISTINEAQTTNTNQCLHRTFRIKITNHIDFIIYSNLLFVV